jgi:hypothetical protein
MFFWRKFQVRQEKWYTAAVLNWMQLANNRFYSSREDFSCCDRIKYKVLLVLSVQGNSLTSTKQEKSMGPLCRCVCTLRRLNQLMEFHELRIYSSHVYTFQVEATFMVLTLCVATDVKQYVTFCLLQNVEHKRRQSEIYILLSVWQG